MNNLENFIKNWNSEQTLGKGNEKIMVCPNVYDDTFYGFDFRFVHCDVDDEKFERLKQRVFMTSRNLLQVTSSLDECKSGILNVAAFPCNHGYSDNAVQTGINVILTELLPDLRRWAHQ